MDQTGVAVSIIDVKDHNDAAGIFVELGSDHLVVVIAREVEEVDAHFLAKDVELLDTVVDPDGGYVPFHKSAFAISLDQAAFSGFRIANTYYLEEYCGWFWHFV
jgi:hypothetical protein